MIRSALVSVGLLTLVVGCGGGGTRLTTWSSPAEIVDGLEDAGLLCRGSWEFQSDDIADLWEERLMHIESAECSEYLDGDILYAFVYESDRDRVVDTYWAAGASCAFLELEQTPYAYGANWAVSSGYGRLDLAAMQGIAQALGGEAVLADCATVDAYFETLETLEATVIDESILREMRVALGEL